MTPSQTLDPHCHGFEHWVNLSLQTVGRWAGAFGLTHQIGDRACSPKALINRGLSQRESKLAMGSFLVSVSGV